MSLPADTVSVLMLLRPGAEPIEGSLQVSDGPNQPFRGWLQLTALLQTAALIGGWADEGGSDT